MSVEVEELLRKHQELVNSRGHVFEWSLRQISPGVLEFITHLGGHLMHEIDGVFPSEGIPQADSGPLKFVISRALLGGYWVRSAELMLQGRIPRPNPAITHEAMHKWYDNEPVLDTGEMPEAVLAAMEFYNGHLQQQLESVCPGLSQWPENARDVVRKVIPNAVMTGYAVGLLEETFPREDDLLGHLHDHDHHHHS